MKCLFSVLFRTFVQSALSLDAHSSRCAQKSDHVSVQSVACIRPIFISIKIYEYVLLEDFPVVKFCDYIRQEGRLTTSIG
jgi:hypothetical protein